MTNLTPSQPKTALDAHIDDVVRDICEWADRTSLEDFPDGLLITPVELTNLLRDFAVFVHAQTVIPAKAATIQGEDTQKSVASKLRIACREVHTVPNSAARLYGEAADLIDAQAAEIARLKDAIEADYDLVTRELAARTTEFVAMKARAIKAEATLAALSGWKLVPITPTQDMLMAGADRPRPDPVDSRDHEWGGMYRAIYGAMLEASPPADRVVTALAQIDRALGPDNATANPLRRIDYPDGRFGPAMLDGDDDMNTREMKLIAKSHGFELRVAVEEWGTEAAEVLDRNGTFGEALEVEDVPQSIVGGYQLVGAWDDEDGALALVYARPLMAAANLESAAAPGASS